VFYRVDKLLGNKQSQLLQEVKNAMFFTFSRTPLRADGPIIAAPFSSYHVEVIPGFIRNDGAYLMAHTWMVGAGVIPIRPRSSHSFKQPTRLLSGRRGI
jgi:hypothetical protein